MTDDTPKGAPAARRTPAAKTPTAKTPATKTPAASKAAPAKRPAAKKTVAEVAPVATAPASPAASAPAGWYPVAGSEQKRWWDGTRWTDHIYNPATAAPTSPAATTPVAPLRAPEGVKPGTVWFWLLAIGAPVLQLLELIPASIWVNQIVAGNPSANSVAGWGLDPLSLVTFLSGWIIAAFCIVIAVLDWRELRARGIPKPFHWAWSFFVIVVGWPVVYVIGRTVVAKRRTGGGMAPLWFFVGLQVVAFIAAAIFVVFVFVEFLTLFSNGLDAVGDIL